MSIINSFTKHLKTEKPWRDLVTHPDLELIQGQIGIGLVRNLLEAFVFPAHFKYVPTDLEIATCGCVSEL